MKHIQTSALIATLTLSATVVAIPQTASADGYYCRPARHVTHRACKTVLYRNSTPKTIVVDRMIEQPVIVERPLVVHRVITRPAVIEQVVPAGPVVLHHYHRGIIPSVYHFIFGG